MDIKFPKAGSVRHFELGVRRLHTPDLLQTYEAHLSFFMYDVYGIMYARQHNAPFEEFLAVFFQNF